MGIDVLEFSDPASLNVGAQSSNVELNHKSDENFAADGFDSLLAYQLNVQLTSVSVDVNDAVNPKVNTDIPSDQELIHSRVFNSETKAGQPLESIVHPFRFGAGMGAQSAESGNELPLPTDLYGQTHPRSESTTVPLSYSSGNGDNSPESAAKSFVLESQDVPKESHVRFIVENGSQQTLDDAPDNSIETFEGNDGSIKEIQNLRIDSRASNAAKQTVISMQKDVGEPGWNEELGERITWLVKKSQSSAQIRLNPPQLGPLEVKIEVIKDQANVTFSSQHSQIREVLEAALPRLRELMGAQQIQVNDASFSQHSFAESSLSNGSESFSQHETRELEAEEESDASIGDQERLEIESITTQGILNLYV